MKLACTFLAMMSFALSLAQTSGNNNVDLAKLNDIVAKFNRVYFKGIKAIDFVGGTVSEGFESDPSVITNEEVTNLVELKLRSSNIKLRNLLERVNTGPKMSDAEFAAWKAVPALTLYVRIGVLKIKGDPRYVYSVKVEVQDNATVDRSGEKFVRTVWEQNTIGYAGSSVFRSAVKDVLDTFVGKLAIDYLKAQDD